MSRPRMIYNEAIITMMKSLISQGVSNAEIARRFGTSERNLQVRMSQLGIRRREVAVHRLATNHVRLTSQSRDRYNAAAADRRLHPKELVQQLMETIAEYDLFSSILGPTRKDI